MDLLPFFRIQNKMIFFKRNFMNRTLLPLRQTNSILNKILSIFLLCSIPMIHAVDFSYQITEKDSSTKTVAVTFLLHENEVIFAPSLDVSINNPHMSLEKSSINIASIKKYIPEYQQDKQVYDQNFTMTINIKCMDDKQPAEGSLHISYVSTLACLGLLATVAGSSFGSLLSQPLFVIALVLFIGYMSLTMIGIVDMYIPPFMQGEIKFYKNFGPYMSAFLFGAISGTIASPCVSPGLALLLSIVATMGNNLLGFILLFAFGIGLSFPLIVIGTFSNSIYLLPKSGMWMVEIKKALGFVMLATCFYYLSNIAPAALVYWLFTGFTLFMAYFYLLGTTQYKKIYTFIGIVMISISIFMATKSYEKTFYNHPDVIHASVD